jgi:hypothetical protein
MIVSNCAHVGQIVRMDESIERHAGPIGARESQHPLERGIDALDRALRAQKRRARRCVVPDRAELCLARLQGAQRALAFADQVGRHQADDDEERD